MINPYLRPLRQWWWLIVAGVLLASASAYLATRHSPLTYVARTTLIVGPSISEPNPSSTDFNLTNQLAQVYADLATRDPVRSQTAKALGLQDLPDYTTNVLPDSRLLEIIVTDTDPVRAAAVANELASELIATSPEGPQSPSQPRRSFIEQQLTSLEASITETQTELDTAQAKLATLKSAVEIADAQDQITALESKLASLQGNYASLLAVTSQGAPNSLSVVEPAIVPTVPIGFSRNMLVALASLIGLALSVGTAYLLDLVDERIHGPEDIQRLVDWRIVGSIKDSAAKDLESLVNTWKDPEAPDMEAARLLANLTFSPSIEKVRRLTITGLRLGKSSGQLAAVLAVSLAGLGKKVVLLDADFHGSELSSMLGLDGRPGLASLAKASSNHTSSQPESDCNIIVPSGYASLDVVGHGDSSSLEDFNSSAHIVREFINDHGSDYDVVIVHGTPLFEAPDSLALCHSADGVLITIDTGNVSRSEVQKAVRMLNSVGANVLGAVLSQSESADGPSLNRGENESIKGIRWRA